VLDNSGNLESYNAACIDFLKETGIM